MYQQHPLSAAFPAMGPDEFQSLKDSITDLGVQNPVTLFEGMVLDGWHRYCAALELGMECPVQELEDWIDPRSFVKAQNKHRRRLSVGAWALIEVSLFKYQWAPAHRPINRAPGAPLPKTREDMAESAGSSVRTIVQAKNVDAKAVPAVKQAVLSGQTSLKAAEQIAKLPADQQEHALAVATAPKPRPVPAPAPEPVSAPPQPPAPPAYSTPPEYSELDAARDQIADLQAALALANLGDVPEVDRNQAAELIEQLRGEVKGLSAQLRAVTSSRDFLMQENAQMKQQLAAQRREIDRLKAVAA